jgi:hypothetical protein
LSVYVYYQGICTILLQRQRQVRDDLRACLKKINLDIHVTLPMFGNRIF